MDNYFKSGDWNTLCDTCGRKFKASQLRPRWDGFMVCKDDWNVRHPLDFIKAPGPQRALPWTRPEATDVYIDAYTCTIEGQSAYADFATADCATVDFFPTL